jgi:hypothetical protein
MPAFGVLGYSGTNNLGDEIQSIAATNLLPKVDYYLNRDNLREEGNKLTEDVWTVMNGWYGQYPERWPPGRKIRPLLTSMHLTEASPSSKYGLIPAEYFLIPPISTYLREHAPIGARDMHTLNLLQKAKIPAYFSGCMTLTLSRPEVARAEDLVVYNNIPADVLKRLRATSRKQLFGVEHVDVREGNPAERIARARELLALYARASCVITSRLHCALPSLAMGTPVLLLDVAGDSYRFAGLNEFVHHCTAASFLSGKFAYDVDDPLPNKTAHLAYRKGLIRSVEDFIATAEAGAPSTATYEATEEDREAAMLNLFRHKGLPEPAWRAKAKTVIKARVENPDHLPFEGNVGANAGALLSGEFYSEREGRLFGKMLYLNGKQLKDSAWSIAQSDWEPLPAG